MKNVNILFNGSFFLFQKDTNIGDDDSDVVILGNLISQTIKIWFKAGNVQVDRFCVRI